MILLVESLRYVIDKRLYVFAGFHVFWLVIGQRAAYWILDGCAYWLEAKGCALARVGTA
jgi:hypothetical protein